MNPQPPQNICITPATATPSRELSGWLTRFARALVVIAIPPFLVLTSIQMVMTETFLNIEYRRPGFPADPYGFSQDDRLTLAPVAIEYLRNDQGIDFLGSLTFDGNPLFNERELKHMEDVKLVTRAAFRVHVVVTLGLIIAIAILSWPSDKRRVLANALFEGGIFSLLLIASLIVLILASWDTFFTQFHQVFFEGESWLFRRSDTLIRLFPEQFWFDIALVIGALTTGGAILLVVATTLWRREPRLTDETTHSSTD